MNNKKLAVILNPPYSIAEDVIHNTLDSMSEEDVMIVVAPRSNFFGKHKLYRNVVSGSVYKPCTSFQDVDISTLICRIDKSNSKLFDGLNETETMATAMMNLCPVKCLQKYFYETSIRSHYAFDNYVSQKQINTTTFTIDDAKKYYPIDKSFALHLRICKNAHFPNSTTAKLNL